MEAGERGIGSNEKLGLTEVQSMYKLGNLV